MSLMKKDNEKSNKKWRLRRIFKNRIFIFVMTALIFCTIGVSAATYFPSNQVTYDNKTSGLKSTDVQGALDELYGVCANPPAAADDLIDDVVTSGDGLYQNGDYYFYKGSNPNNYVTFNNEQAGWRIVAIESDKTIKLRRVDTIGSLSYGDTYKWDTSSLKEYLNGDYYNSLTQTAKNQIVLYNNNLSYDPGKINIISQNEFTNAGGWMKPINCNSTSQFTWTINNEWGNKTVVSVGVCGGSITELTVMTPAPVYPVVHIRSDIKIKSGNGTQSNPYIFVE